MRNRKSHRTGVSTFASRTSPSTDQSLQKSFHLSSPDKIELKKISYPSENKKYATAQTNTTKTMTVKLNGDNGLQRRTTEHQLPTAVLQKWRCSASYDSEVVNQNLVLRLKFSDENRHLRKAAKRCGAIRRHIGSPDCMRRCGLERLTSANLRDFSADRSFATPAPKPRKSGDPLIPISRTKKINKTLN
ncbi:MAG: hypothetical protein KBF37_01890 [Saprospiraceae bacterium]|nr:hypothetical protein [Saprospiraceae bacterium]